MIARAALLFFLVITGPASAAEFEAAGLTFSDELGGFRLLGVSGAGTADDPLVISEQITGDAPAILTIRQTVPLQRGDNLLTASGFFLIHVVKQVANASGRDWGAFDMELRQEPPTPSDYRDGLSFAQMLGSARPTGADRFARWRQLDEPADRITFFEGNVPKGGSASFRIVIADTTPGAIFYLLQEPRVVISRRAPSPSPELATLP